MATSNRQKVDEAFVALSEALRPYVEGELRGMYGEGWLQAWPSSAWSDGKPTLHDPLSLLRAINWQWKEVFRERLDDKARSWANELQEWRHDHAHHTPVHPEDALRVLDTARRLLGEIGAADAADRVDTLHADLQREQYEARAKKATKQATLRLEGESVGTLKAWREVAVPHPDVREGRYEQAEFAAKLYQVVRGEGRPEYRDAEPFFARTYLTEGLRELLRTAIRRTSGRGGEPVVQLQVQFGGGKTHALLALWHLFRGSDPARLQGVPELLREEGLDAVPKALPVALVGTELTPGSPSVKHDGTVVRTLWGELAWGLADRAGYEIVRENDENGTSPGERLRDLFRMVGPCVILIDEWVAYARQLYDRREPLPAGTFEAHMSFVQALTEAATTTDGVLLVVTLPQSERELVGPGGAEALSVIKHYVGRQDRVWRLAETTETFEIVRRRLFMPITDAMAPHRDAACRAFADYYAQRKEDFPIECREPAYRKRLEETYPIHPELFRILYEDWSTLERFQRTRGVLRLMALVIHALWKGESQAPLILPGSVPLADSTVQALLVNLLEERWSPVIESDVDGESSAAYRLDVETPAFNPSRAAERAARCVFLATAPHKGKPGHGTDDRRVRVGSATPGDPSMVYSDALIRLEGKSAHLYHENDRYWFDTQPSLNRKAREYAEEVSDDSLSAEIRQRLDPIAANRGAFEGVHPCPEPGDIPDDRKLRLVILGTDHTQKGPKTTGSAVERAEAILRVRNGGLRERQNRLVFLALGEDRRSGLVDEVRQFLAWQKICKQAEALELTPTLVKQAQARQKQHLDNVATRVRSGYEWVLVPYQEAGSSEIEWQARRVPGDDAPALRVMKKLVQESEIVAALGPKQLLDTIDEWNLWEGEGVSVKSLLEHYAKWLYLYRLQNDEVLLTAVGSILNETIAEHGYAEGYDPSAKEYLRVHAPHSQPRISESGYLVKPSVVERAERKQTPAPVVSSSGGLFGGGASSTGNGSYPKPPTGGMVTAVSPSRRFHASKDLDPYTLETQMAEIAKKVIQHLMVSPDAKVKVSLYIEGQDAAGFSDKVESVVREQCKSLGFGDFGFEHE